VNKHFKFGKASLSALWYLLLVVVLPTLTLAVAGTVFLWQHGYLLHTMAAWLVVSFVSYGILIFWPKLKSKKRAEELASELEDNQHAATSMGDVLFIN